jgi:F0F1-type ATP synthase assembly protein I
MEMAEKQDGNWAKFLGVGFEVAAGVGLGYFIGSYIDRKFGSAPWGLLIGVLFGAAAGMYLLISEVIKMNKE